MKSDKDGSRLSVSKHLDELRSRVTKSVLAVVVTTAIAFVFHRQILLLLMEPADRFSQTPYGGPIYTHLTEFISIAFKVSLLAGLFLALPFVLYQIVMFVAPGLTPKERRYLYALVPATIIAFAAGAVFGHQVLLPPAVWFPAEFLAAASRLRSQASAPTRTSCLRSFSGWAWSSRRRLWRFSSRRSAW